jgi:hypothetical protein
MSNSLPSAPPSYYENRQLDKDNNKISIIITNPDPAKNTNSPNSSFICKKSVIKKYKYSIITVTITIIFTLLSIVLISFLIKNNIRPEDNKNKVK